MRKSSRNRPRQTTKHFKYRPYNSPKTTYLKNYTPPPFLVDKVDLEIELGEEWSTVKARLCFRSNPDFKGIHPTFCVQRSSF